MRRPSSWRRLAWAVALLGTAVALRAQPFETPPPPAPPRPFNLAVPTEQRLPNGLRVVVAQRSGMPIVTARLVVLSGSEYDPPGRAGLASMAAGLLAKGTRQRSASAQAHAAESLGGSLDSGAGWDHSEVAITVATPNLDAALGLVGDAVMQPTFAQAELDRFRTQSLDSLKVSYTQPGTLAALAADRLLFGGGPYGHPAAGTPASLPHITRADVVALHAALYRPDNAALVLAGDIDGATALRLATRHFGAWKAARVATGQMPVGTAARRPMPASVVIDLPQAGQAAVVVLAPLPPPGADRPAMATLNSVLGTGYSSRLNQEVRIKRGLSYGATSQLDQRRQGGALVASVQTKNESAAEVLSLMQAELDRLIATPVGDDELAARKATLIGNFSRAVETTAGLSQALRSLLVAGLPLDDLGQRIARLQAVTAADVQRVAATHLSAQGRRIAVAGDTSLFGPDLQAQLPGAATVAHGQLDLERAGRLTKP